MSTSTLYWNCASGLYNKLGAIRDLIKATNYDLIFIAEADIKLKHRLDLYKIEGCRIETSSTLQSKGKCRMICYVNNLSNIKRLTNLEHDSNEIIVMGHKNNIIAGIYFPYKIEQGETRQSNLQRLIKNLADISIKQNDNVVDILGDFNVNLLKESKELETLRTWSDSFGLAQLVDQITRTRIVHLQDGYRIDESIIDHCYTTDESKIDLLLIETNVSDHKALAISRNHSQTTRIKQKVIIVDWRKYSPTAFLIAATKKPQRL